MGANARRYSQTQIEIIASELPVKKLNSIFLRKYVLLHYTSRCTWYVTLSKGLVYVTP